MSPDRFLPHDLFENNDKKSKPYAYIEHEHRITE